MAAEPPHPDRAWIASVRRVVVKIGSRVLVDAAHGLDEAHLESLVDQMAGLRRRGLDVVCVSSGAIAAGLGALGLSRRPRDMPSLQAAAAVGQARLMALYRTLFLRRDLEAAQVLLTHDDLRSRERHLNARNTFSRLLGAGVVPIVNENDTVSVDEIRFGDNDRLSALVAMLVRADLLVLLTTADGLLTRPPGARGAAAGALLHSVDAITDEVRAMAGDSDSPLAVGGMRSKLRAAEEVTGAGERAIIAHGREGRVLERLFDGALLGTAFAPRPRRLAGRKRWIAFFDHPRGEVTVDEGAAGALRDGGRSLLAIGVRAVSGAFERGAPVRIVGPDGAELARGLVNYPAADLKRIAGRRSEEIAAILGACEYPEVVHRDNLVLRR